MQKNLAITIFALLGALISAPPAHAFLLAGLSDAEQSYHEQVFSYAMDNTLPGKTYEWKTYSGNGNFLIGEPFISKSGSNCREYTETYELQGEKAQLKGVGCKRSGKSGWCSLKPENALTCALEKRHYMAGRRYVTPSPGGGGGGGAPGAPNADPSFSGGGISAPNVNTNVNMNAPQAPKQGQGGDPTAKGVAYDVTNTLGNAGAQGTGMALGWWDALFR